MDDVDLNTNMFIRIYRSFLSSGGELEIDQIIKPFIEMQPFLHSKAAMNTIDVGAFIYSLLRLPDQIFNINSVILSQSMRSIKREGFESDNWKESPAPARRRKMYTQDEDLFVIINSVTDVDDLVCLLTSFQIEWNKINSILNLNSKDSDEAISTNNSEWLSRILGNSEIIEKLGDIKRVELFEFFRTIKSKKMQFKVTQLRGSYIDYSKSGADWFENIIAKTNKKDFTKRPIYFISSNTHSIVNNITGFVNEKEDELVKFMREKNMSDLLEFWEGLNDKEIPGSRENFLWYILKKYEKENPQVRTERIKYEQELGVDYIEAREILDVNAQLIDLKKLANSHLPSKLNRDLSGLKNSDAVILNIDYPLGFGAYMVLSTVLQFVDQIKGIYILGKASFLNGKLGDIALPVRIFDEHSKNTYIFKNAFTKKYLEKYEGNSILTNQNAVSTKGTLLHPEESLKNHFRNGYTVLEMENGPYLNAVFEMTNYKRYPERKTLSLIDLPFDLGIIHYASDTPFTKAISLGTRNLGYDGVEPTYNSSLAILERIVDVELG